MNLSLIRFIPVCEVGFTKVEVEWLMKLSAWHYDGVCRNAGRLGGFLYGINNHFVLDEEHSLQASDVQLTFGEIDILCKILERADRFSDVKNLVYGLGDCLKRLKAVADLQQVIR